MVLPIGSQVTGFGFEERADAGPLTLVTGIKDHAAAALFSSFLTFSWRAYEDHLNRLR